MAERFKLAEHFISINGEGRCAGELALFLRFAGCNLRCDWCDTAWACGADAPFVPASVGDIAQIAADAAAHGVRNVTLTGGEPLLQARFVGEYLRLCKQAGLHTAVDTSGAVWTDNARKVMNYCDLVLLDVKTTDDLVHQSYTGMARTNNHRWFEYLKEIGKPLWGGHVLVPGRTADEQHVRAVADYLHGYSGVIERVDLLPYHTMGVYKYEELDIDYPLEGVPPLSDERLEELRKLFFAHFQ